MKEKKKEEKVEISKILLTKFVKGKTSLISKGTSKIFIQVPIEENDKIRYEVKEISIPIRSTGVVESQGAVEMEEPQPPKKTVVLKKDDFLTTQLDKNEGDIVEIFDYTDESYIEAKNKYNEKLLWTTVINGIDIIFVNEEENEITDTEEKIDILKNSGITFKHLYQISNDINKLTLRVEKEADFLSEST